jgi:hypothetical protein
LFDIKVSILYTLKESITPTILVDSNYNYRMKVIDGESKMLKELIKLSNTLDDLGLTGEANSIDGIIHKLFGNGSVSRDEYCEDDDASTIDSYAGGGSLFGSIENDDTLEKFAMYLEDVNEEDIVELAELIALNLDEELLQKLGYEITSMTGE